MTDTKLQINKAQIIPIWVKFMLYNACKLLNTNDKQKILKAASRQEGGKTLHTEKKKVYACLLTIFKLDYLFWGY